jgi:hypothetical protein
MALSRYFPASVGFLPPRIGRVNHSVRRALAAASFYVRRSLMAGGFFCFAFRPFHRPEKNEKTALPFNWLASGYNNTLPIPDAWLFLGTAIQTSRVRSGCSKWQFRRRDWVSFRS